MPEVDKSIFGIHDRRDGPGGHIEVTPTTIMWRRMARIFGSKECGYLMSKESLRKFISETRWECVLPTFRTLPTTSII